MSDSHDANDMNRVSAQHTDEIEEAPDPDAVADPDASNGTTDSTTDVQDLDDYTTYEHDLNDDDNRPDPIIDEETDDPTEGFGIPPDEFKDELDKQATDEGNVDQEDMRETIEDQDEDDDNAASTA